MPLTVFGLNHKSAPVSVREKLAHLCGLPIPDVDGCDLESVPVYTCNRVEVYYAGNPAAAQQSFVALLAQNSINYDNLSEYFYRYNDEEAVSHLLSVASGLDSMILGENQILHQIKESYRHSTEQGFVGKQLHSLFQKALEVGKKVRSETGISQNRVSIASTAVELARSIFGPLSNSIALVVGAGEMASLVAVHLRENGVKKMLFVNRTEASALELAEKFDGESRPFEQFEELLERCDIVISSTAAPTTIVSTAMMRQVMAKRSERPMFVVDIAVPRDFENDCQEIGNLFLYDVDDLQNVVNENMSQRHVEADKARAIVQYESSQFQTSVAAFTVVPLISRLREQAEAIRQAEIERFLAQHPDLQDEHKQAFDQCSRALMAKWLHNQIVALKKQGSADIEQLRAIGKTLGLADDCLPQAPLRMLGQKSGKQ
ncbi:MAG: glutamyl-tRNA reductase [Candidatus Riflebacteria bacterium]|nr:glutamyl-tRNA reductase [Candidatus Riflebacteria bacterium]